MAQKSKQAASGLGEALFTKTQRKVLGLLFGQPHRRYYGNEIIQLAGVGTGSARSFLHDLVASGIINTTKEGNQKYYQANQESPIYEELRGIAIKTFGLAEVLQNALAPFAESISIAFVFGSVAKGVDHAKSDVDLLIVGEDIDYLECMKSLTQLSKEIGRDVMPSIYPPNEFLQKWKEQNHFIERIVEQPKIMIIGTEDDLKKLGKDRAA